MYRRIGLYTLLLAGLAAVVTLLAPASMQAQADTLCFEESEFCIEGRIREFWEANGALPVFGLPITPQREELIEGQPRTVQWFERNRLELHPENERPYDVLVGRLGVDTLEQQGRNWQEFARAEGPQDGCLYFEQTGQNVCDAILLSWQVEGIDLNQDGISGNSDAESLALFGLPISGQISETLDDGQQYTVQYFERARFELHPENEPPFNVLLGRLGNEVLQEEPGDPGDPGDPGTQPEPPAPAPDASIYNGSWRGETSQGRPIAFNVNTGGVATIALEYELDDCNATLTQEFTFEDYLPIANGAFRWNRQGEVVVDLVGTFESATTASGTLQVNSSTPDCSGSLDDVSWTASRE